MNTLIETLLHRFLIGSSEVENFVGNYSTTEENISKTKGVPFHDRKFTLDGVQIDMNSFLNQEQLSKDKISQIRSLKPGDSIDIEGGVFSRKLKYM